MKPKFTFVAASIVVTGLVTASPALALSADDTFLPPVQMQGDVSYVTGGVGEDEATAFKDSARQFPVELLFAERAQPRDEYLANVQVTIRDSSGVAVLDTTTNGPYLLAKLPAGKYAVEANYNGALKHQMLNVHRGTHQRKVFVWTDAEANDSVLSSAD